MNTSILTAESSFVEDVNDSDFDPDFNDEIHSTDYETNDESSEMNRNRCFLVYESELKALLHRCLICGDKVDSSLTKESLVNGSQLSITLHCFSGHTST